MIDVLLLDVYDSSRYVHTINYSLMHVKQNGVIDERLQKVRTIQTRTDCFDIGEEENCLGDEPIQGNDARD